LLNFSNIHERPQIRQIALDKLSLHPDLTGAVARELTDGAAYEAIIHLQGSVPPESERLADPIRIGIERIADQLQSSIQGAHTLHVGAGMSQVERILDVLRKHADPRVDYRPAMRKLRAVFDHGRDGQVRLQAAAVLDRWLAKANRQAARQ
jgi:hypothetical protein